jgi:hypothetical protein
MITTNRKKVTVVLFLAAFTAFGVAAYNPAKEKKVQGSYRSDTSLFKNLKVLPKDISKDSLDTIMHGFNNSLGVKCFFCHVHEGNDFKTGWKFDSDEKPEKETARYMLKMTAGINATYFNIDSTSRPDTITAVRCVTCHRGIPHPDAEGIADQMKMINSGGNMPPPPGNQPPPPGNQPPPKKD